MAIHLLAFVLAGGMAVGDSGAKGPAIQVPQAATPADLRLENAARDYRIQTYETFHTNRAEYDRRQAEGIRIQKAWTDAGENPVEQPLLIDWLEQAKARSQADSIGELPPLPTFTVMPKKPEPEKKLVETSTADSVDDAAAKIDGLLHVKPVASTNAATDSSPNSGVDTSSAAAPEKPGAAVPQSKPSLIGSLPNEFGAEISRTLKGLSGKSAPNAPSQGH